MDHGNGWRSSYPDCLGNFKSCYAARYSIAKRGYLALTNDQAWYPTKDGEFCILLQPADITPPAEWMNNWLLAPSGGGKFSITLRWYGATKEMMTKSYEYPKIEYINAMTASRRPML